MFKNNFKNVINFFSYRHLTIHFQTSFLQSFLNFLPSKYQVILSKCYANKRRHCAKLLPLIPMHTPYLNFPCAILHIPSPERNGRKKWISLKYLASPSHVSTNAMCTRVLQTFANNTRGSCRANWTADYRYCSWNACGVDKQLGEIELRNFVSGSINRANSFLTTGCPMLAFPTCFQFKAFWRSVISIILCLAIIGLVWFHK